MKGLMSTLLSSKSKDFNHLLAPQLPGLPPPPMEAFESDWKMSHLKHLSSSCWVCQSLSQVKFPSSGLLRTSFSGLVCPQSPKGSPVISFSPAQPRPHSDLPPPLPGPSFPSSLSLQPLHGH